MCNYEQYRFACGDFKWGKFRKHCSKEYRIGETCGMKLIYKTIQKPEKCVTCTAIDRKSKKVMELKSKIKRWQLEGDKPATVEKTYLELAEVEAKLKWYIDEHNKWYNNVGTRGSRGIHA